MRELGGVLGIAIGVAAFAGSGSYASPTEFADGFTAAISVAAGLSLLAALFGAALPARLGVGASAGAGVEAPESA
jgi:hypothetical protein